MHAAEHTSKKAREKTDRMAIDIHLQLRSFHISPRHERVTFQNVKIFEVAKWNVCCARNSKNNFDYLKNIFFETDFTERIKKFEIENVSSVCVLNLLLLLFQRLGWCS